MRLHASLRRREVTEADGPEARGQRGIFIEHGMVAFVTSYHKGYSASQRVRILHRYVPREVGELVVYYLWLVQPFVQCLQAAAPQEYDAIGTYYLSTSRIPEARSYFSKASLMDPHFGPAWIGFAHTFAAEGESDQAIAAYSTAARLFQGTHLPQLSLAMQQIQLDNLAIAREYLTGAYNMCKTDPLLINELGVCAYKEGDLDSAIRSFDLALKITEENGAPPRQSREARLNLAHALRKSGRFTEALEQFDEVIRLGLREAGVFAAKGLVLLELERAFGATVALHEGLAISPQDPVAGELLARALGLLEGEGVLGGKDE
ncbi:anaphase-promoting complex subunit Cut9 [Friedmanniomyces endolithicus]|nr:anaphase-promoting complex subunit Cut9 [Friedmanniomyces endolithicus]